jgi:hypothetical protein
MQGIDQVQINDATLAKADGMVLRTRWSAIEKSPGVFDLSYIKGQIARCNRMGKKIYLQILSGDDAPHWLSSQGAKIHQYQEASLQKNKVTHPDNSIEETEIKKVVLRQIPLPWDEVYLTRYEAMIKHVSQNIDMTSVTHVPPIGADNSEWHYNQFSGFYSAAGMSDDNMVNAHVRAAGIIAKHMPKVIVTVNIGDHTRSWTAKAIAALKAKYKGRIGFQMCSLKADNSPTYDGITRIKKAREEGFHVGMETVGPSIGANGQAVERFGGPYSAAIKMANDVMGDSGVLSTYQWDLEFNQK